jgi:hypothetical protein
VGRLQGLLAAPGRSLQVKRKDLLVPTLAALPGLFAAGAGWLQADAAERREHAKAMEAQRAWDSYGAYVRDQMQKAGCQPE